MKRFVVLAVFHQGVEYVKCLVEDGKVELFKSRKYGEIPLDLVSGIVATKISTHVHGQVLQDGHVVDFGRKVSAGVDRAVGVGVDPSRKADINHSYPSAPPFGSLFLTRYTSCRNRLQDSS